MDSILMSTCMTPTEEETLRNEIESLKALLSTETERNGVLVSEVARLHESLHQASLECGRVHQLRSERDMFRRQLEDQLKFRRAPLEAQLVEANRVLAEQRQHFRNIVDATASQRDWVREWAIQSQENMRLQEVLAKREAGTEVPELRRLLLDMHAKFADLTLSFKQRDATVAAAESNVQSLMLEKGRLVTENTLLREKNGRLWRRLESVGKNAVHKLTKHLAPTAQERYPASPATSPSN